MVLINHTPFSTDFTASMRSAARTFIISNRKTEEAYEEVMAANRGILTEIIRLDLFRHELMKYVETYKVYGTID